VSTSAASATTSSERWKKQRIMLDRVVRGDRLCTGEGSGSCLTSVDDI
jgi:hypothetical protein